MQTFLPYPSFQESAACLDYRRLGKQRVEAWQILQTLTGKSSGWANHPSVKMWEGYENALCLYGLRMCLEWIKRDYKDTLYNRIHSFVVEDVNSPFPPWLGNESFHASHRSNLLRKDPVHYSQFGWTEAPDLPYVWPTNEVLV